MRHINIKALGMQEVQDRKAVEFNKTLAPNIPADLMTQYLNRETIDKHFAALGQELKRKRREGIGDARLE